VSLVLACASVPKVGGQGLTSTQVYTRVSIAKLKAVHTATHPAATLARREAGADAPPLGPARKYSILAASASRICGRVPRRKWSP